MQNEENPKETPESGAEASKQSTAADKLAEMDPALRQTVEDVFKRLDQLANLPPPLAKRVKLLKKNDEERAEIVKKEEEEKRALEKKYEALYKPFFDRRREVVLGQLDAEDLTEEEKQEAAKVKGIPKFWLQAMKNHFMLSSYIHEQDEPLIEKLVDVRSTVSEDGKTMRIEFEFEENEFMEDKLLTKEYVLASNNMIEASKGSEIHWKTGKNLTVKTVKKKQKNRSGARRVVTREEPCPSFFQFFSPPAIPDEEGLDKMDDDERDELQNVVETDFELGMIIKDKIVPNAVDWFTGMAEDSDYENDEEDEEGEDEEEDDDEEQERDNEEEDDEEEEEAAPKGKKRASKNAAAQGEEKPPECKKQ